MEQETAPDRTFIYGCMVVFCIYIAINTFVQPKKDIDTVESFNSRCIRQSGYPVVSAISGKNLCINSKIVIEIDIP